ncbi:MAG: hypothetical protein GTN38_00185 [Candidatus Aenigmarchaeota archaeon]|nr:hypothetical protein [Candidatus Aenigmarchaeota archaeon]
MVFVISLFLTAYSVQAITINEFMPDPDDNCRDCSEWIEITSYVNLSLENITVDTGENPITLNGSIGKDEFIIITKNSSAFAEIWDSEVRVFENNRMSLRNSGDNISLYNGSSLLQKIVYNSSETNRSYGLCNSTFILQNISTPGLPNTCLPKDTNETNETNQTNVTNGTCDLSLSIASDLIFNSGERQNYHLSVEDRECDQEVKEVSIEYWIEDLFGRMVRSNYTTTQNMTCNKNISRQWTPKEIGGSEAYYIVAEIREFPCNDSDHSNDLAEKLIVVKGGETDPEQCPPCENGETTCSCAPCPKCTSEDEEEEFEIIYFPYEISKDEEIEIYVRMSNILDYQRDYTLYSYIYEGKKPLSLGFDGSEWLNTWDANRRNASIPGNSSALVTLSNRIAEDTEPGEYKLRVRIWCENKKHDITREIFIKESLEPENQTMENETSDVSEPENETAGMVTTGRIISKRDENWFSAFIENVMNFFKNLFNL